MYRFHFSQCIITIIYSTQISLPFHPHIPITNDIPFLLFLFQPPIRKQLLIIFRPTRRHASRAQTRQLVTVELVAAGISVVDIASCVDCRNTLSVYYYNLPGQPRLATRSGTHFFTGVQDKTHASGTLQPTACDYESSVGCSNPCVVRTRRRRARRPPLR